MKNTPPRAVKTISDLIFWQYAKIIAASAGFENQYGFIMKKFKQLQREEMKWSSTIREYLKEREVRDACIYCGDTSKLTVEHIIPRKRGGPDTPDNVVMVCKACNSSKRDRRLYEWFGLERRNKIPRIAEGKYLKLLYDLHSREGTLGVCGMTDLCPRCDMSELCPAEGKLSVFCLEGFLGKV